MSDYTSRGIHKLSARFVAMAVAPGRFSDGGSLYLSVSPNGGKRWVFLFRWRGRPREMGLGSARSVTLARARDRAAEARRLLADGLDPIAETRRQEAPIPTFTEAAAELMNSLEPSWRGTRQRRQWEQTFFDYAKPLADMPVDTIEVEHVLKALRPIWTTKPATASLVRSRIERVLDAARAQGQREGENPARWRGHLAMLLPASRKLVRGHFAAMSYQDMPAFMGRLRALQGTSARCLEFQILTAARPSEALGASWEEIDLVQRLWIIPAGRMKAAREHRVPLTSRALEILEIMKRESGTAGLVFPSRKPGRPRSGMELARAIQRAEGGPVTAHGSARSSFRDWAGDASHFPREVAEAALAHSVGNATELAYRRSTALEKRRAMMDAWESYLLQRPQDGSNVLQFLGAR
jgi:integrase